MPRISVITPSYNQAEFLEKTILSVLHQDILDLEYIIVDGGSTDGSIEIIQKYADQLAWWISEPDDGQADAINKGFQRATGEIVAWINSDDLYAPGAITQAAAVLSNNPDLGMVYGNALSFDQAGFPLNDLTYADWGLEGLLAFKVICQPAVFMRHAVLEAAGYLDTSYHYLLDHHLWIRMARIANIRHIPKVWAFARHHAEAKNVAQASGFGREAYRILDWAQSQPELTDLIKNDLKPIWSAAHRFNARYLLDGGRAWEAIKAYGRSFVFHPATALKEWHRVLFAILSVLGLGSLGNLYYQVKRFQLPSAVRDLGIDNIDQLYKVD